VRGRDFSDGDDLKSEPVLIINQTLARRFFSDQDPVGQRIDPGIENGYSNPPLRAIVGVVGDVKEDSLRADPSPQIYVPLAQCPFDEMTLVVRSEAGTSNVISSIRNEISRVAKTTPVFDVKSLDQYLAASVAQPQFNALLLGLFAGASLLLAVVGLFGVVSYSVTQRTREIGIRVALGAQPNDVFALVMRQGFVLGAFGVAAGLLGSLWLTRVLSNLLFGVTATDPITFATVALFLLGVVTAATYVPARRATKVDPMVALRYE
jgi:putative ABC transport system permease protein